MCDAYRKEYGNGNFFFMRGPDLLASIEDPLVIEGMSFDEMGKMLGVQFSNTKALMAQFAQKSGEA